MYYYVREAFSESDDSFSEGFANTLKLTSELSDGQICIDGQIKYDMAFGDICQVDN